jgi:hypothetical protein
VRTATVGWNDSVKCGLNGQQYPMKNSLRSIAIIARLTTPKLRRHGKGWLVKLALSKPTSFSPHQTSWRAFTYFVIDRLTTGLLRGDRAMMRSASLHWLKTKNPDFIGT